MSKFKLPLAYLIVLLMLVPIDVWAEDCTSRHIGQITSDLFCPFGCSDGTRNNNYYFNSLNHKSKESSTITGTVNMGDSNQFFVATPSVLKVDDTASVSLDKTNVFYAFHHITIHLKKGSTLKAKSSNNLHFVDKKKRNPNSIQVSFGENSVTKLEKSVRFWIKGPFQLGPSSKFILEDSTTFLIGADSSSFSTGSSASLKMGKSSSVMIGEDNSLSLGDNTKFKMGQQSLYQGDAGVVLCEADSSVTLGDSSKLCISGEASKLQAAESASITLGDYSILSVIKDHSFSMTEQSFLLLGLQSSYTGNAGKFIYLKPGIGITIEDRAHLIIETGMLCEMNQSVTIPEGSTLIIARDSDPFPNWWQSSVVCTEVDTGLAMDV